MEGPLVSGELPQRPLFSSAFFMSSIRPAMCFELVPSLRLRCQLPDLPCVATPRGLGGVRYMART